MIAGEIIPPGCYLSAIEILRRQYVAHLADLAARGQLPGVLPMPRRASALFGESGWLRRLVTAVTSDSAGTSDTGESAALVEAFLGLFGDHVDGTSRATSSATSPGLTSRPRPTRPKKPGTAASTTCAPA